MMKINGVIFISLLLIVLIGFNVQLSAQESVHAAGENGTGTGGSVSFTVGQIVYKTFTASGFSISQGVQQPYEISVLTGSAIAPGINLTISAYPNPATDYLILKLTDMDYSAYSFLMFDAKGKLLREGLIENYETKISMTEFSPATYFFKVVKNRQQIKLFKIVKM